MAVQQVRIARSSLPNKVRVSITSAIDNGNGTVTYSFNKPHRLLSGYIVDILNVSPSEFNQSNAKVIIVNNEISFTISKTTTAKYVSGGYIEVPINAETDTYLVRYRIVNKKNETSQWSPLFTISNSYDEDTAFNYLDGGES